MKEFIVKKKNHQGRAFRGLGCTDQLFLFKTMSLQ